MITTVYEFSSKKVVLKIKVAVVNGKISSGCEYADGYEYCGSPAENLNYFKTEQESIIYQCDYFIKMFDRIIEQNEVKSRIKEIKKVRLSVIQYKYKMKPYK